MERRPPWSTRTDPLFPYPTVFLSVPCFAFRISCVRLSYYSPPLAAKCLRATELIRAGVDIANRSTRRRREAIRTMDEKDGTPVHGGPGSRTSSYPPGAIPFVRRPSTRPSLGVRRRLI